MKKISNRTLTALYIFSLFIISPALGMGSPKPTPVPEPDPVPSPDGPLGLMNALFNGQAKFVVDQESMPLMSPNSGHREAFAVNRTDLGTKTVFLYHRCFVQSANVGTICLSVSEDGLETYSKHYGEVMRASQVGYFAVAPTVAKVGSKWVMVFEESPYGPAWADSDNGINWNYKGVLFKNGKKGTWDYRAVSTPSIFVDTNNTIFIFYAAYADEAMHGNIGFLSGLSMDKLVKSPKNPVFRPVSSSLWDGGHLSMPRIIKERDYYYMIYEGANKDFSCKSYNTYGWGAARSKDLINWERHNGNPLGLGNPGCGNDMPNIFKRYDDMDFVFHTHKNRKFIVKESLR